MKKENKNAVLQIRTDAKTKGLFQIACNYSGVTQTEVLTKAMNDFIASHIIIEEDDK